MPSLSSGVKYGAEGAAVGTSIAPGIGTAIGGALGFLGGLFGGQDVDVEAIRERRFKDFMNVLRSEKKSTIEREAKRQSGLTQRAASGAARRALATGDIGSKEAYILPSQAEMTRVGTQSLLGIEDKFTQTQLQAEMEYAGRPIEPGTMDYLMEAGKTAGEFFNMDRYIKALGQYSPSTMSSEQPGSTNVPSMDSIDKYIQDQLPYNEMDERNMFFDLNQEG